MGRQGIQTGFNIYGQVPVKEQRRREKLGITDEGARSAYYRQQEANKYASEEARKQREFTASQRREAFQQFTSFVSPFLEQLTGDLDGSGGGYTDEEQSGLSAATEAIESRGEEDRSKLVSSLARRRIYRGGTGLAAEAKKIGETTAQIGEAYGKFAESSAERRLKERLSKRETLASAISGAQGSFL